MNHTSPGAPDTENTETPFPAGDQRKLRCSLCDDRGHNRRTCRFLPADQRKRHFLHPGWEHGLILLRRGQTPHEVARQVGATLRTVLRWAREAKLLSVAPAGVRVVSPRRQMAERLLRLGLRPAEVGRLMGVSRQRASQWKLGLRPAQSDQAGDAGR